MIKKIKENKAITLIALVITIIVLLILAGVAISMLSGENGILNQAAKAKTETEKKSTEEAVRLAVTASMINTGHTIDLETLKSEIQSSLGSDVTVEEDGFGGYIIGKPAGDGKTNIYGVVDAEGKVAEGKWHFVKPTAESKEVEITDGNIRLIVGHKINYSPIRKEDGKDLTDEELNNEKYKCNVSDLADEKEYTYTYTTKEYSGEKDTWGILGVENGKMLIAPMYSIIPTTSTYNDNKTCLYLSGQKGYQNGVNALTDISKIYGYGKGAEGARSITVEDINKVTGYDPNYVGQNVNKTEKGSLTLNKYDAEKVSEYGNQVTYSCKETEKTDWRWYSKKDGKEKTGAYSNSFTYLKGSEWHKLTEGESITLTSTYYYYYPETLTTSSESGQSVGIGQSTEAYKMLFLNTDTKPSENTVEDETNRKQGWYWLGSSCIGTYEINASFGMRSVYYGFVGNNCYLYSTSGDTYDKYRGVRPAVILRSDVEIDGTGDVYTIK